MPNLENLKNGVATQFKTGEEAAERGAAGGIASGEARRKKRDLRRAIEALLEKDFTDRKGNVLSGAEAIAAKQFEKAMAGDPRAFELLRDTAGQKPVDKVLISEVDQAVIDDVERLVNEASEDLEE